MKHICLSLVLTLLGGSIYSQNSFSKLVFEDNFNTIGLPDTLYWSFESGYVRNGELQYYTSYRTENCYQKDGLLHIVTLNDSAKIEGAVRPITSSSIYSKSSWSYCKIEVRAKLPSCLGTWPAIWMMPIDNSYGEWPKSGEIDIMEHVGYEPNSIHYAVHSESYNHTKDNQKRHTIDCPTSYSEFHIYALEWHPDRIEWYLDGVKQYSVKKEKGAKWSAWPFDQPFYLILNSAFGGGWGGRNGVNTADLPQEYLIDYVRIYQ